MYIKNKIWSTTKIKYVLKEENAILQKPVGKQGKKVEEYIELLKQT